MKVFRFLWFVPSVLLLVLWCNAHFARPNFFASVSSSFLILGAKEGNLSFHSGLRFSSLFNSDAQVDFDWDSNPYSYSSDLTKDIESFGIPIPETIPFDSPRPTLATTIFGSYSDSMFEVDEYKGLYQIMIGFPILFAFVAAVVLGIVGFLFIGKTVRGKPRDPDTNENQAES